MVAAAVRSELLLIPCPVQAGVLHLLRITQERREGHEHASESAAENPDREPCRSVRDPGPAGTRRVWRVFGTPWRSLATLSFLGIPGSPIAVVSERCFQGKLAAGQVYCWDQAWCEGLHATASGQGGDTWPGLFNPFLASSAGGLLPSADRGPDQVSSHWQQRHTSNGTRWEEYPPGSAWQASLRLLTRAPKAPATPHCPLCYA